MNNMQLVAAIMQRIGVLGDAELAGMIGELLQTQNNEQTSTTEKEIKNGKYIMCVEATVNGNKIQHPVIGGSGYPRNIEDFKMTIGDNLVKLQQDTESYKRMIESSLPVKVRYVAVTDEQVEALQQKLTELLTSLTDAIDKAAEAKREAAKVVNVELTADDISKDMLAEIIRKVYYSGAGIAANGDIVDTKEMSDEEKEIRRKKETSNTTATEEDDGDTFDCDGDCCNCDKEDCDDRDEDCRGYCRECDAEDCACRNCDYDDFED